MSRIRRYPMSETLAQMCQMLRLPHQNVLRRAGLPPDFLSQPEATVTAAMYFRIWDAVAAEARRPNLAMEMGLAYAKGPFSSPLFAFSSSANLICGLTRLAEFKPLLGPMRITVERCEDAVVATFCAAEPELSLPDCLCLFELTYIVECARIYTTENIVPLQAICPVADHATPEAIAHLGVPVTDGPEVQLVFALADACQPFITRNDSLWEALEPGLRQRLSALEAESSMRARVKTVLWETLAGGVSTSDAVAERLHVSKRSLQRRLTEEGVTFKDILTETRTELSEHYLRKPEMSLAEIAFLLGFRDPTSFFRAFQRWTGKTPNEMRRSLSG